MKTFFKSMPLLALLTFMVFNNQAMAQFDFDQYDSNAAKALVLFQSHQFIEAQPFVDRLSKQIQQFFDNADYLEATEAWETIRTNPLFGTGRIYISEEDPRHKALFRIYEQLDAISSRGKEIQLRFTEQALLGMETIRMPELEETARISNKSGVKIVADFYATSRNANIAVSPPSMVATYTALTHIAKGKTKEELLKLLSLGDNEKPAFEDLIAYLSHSSVLYKPQYPHAHYSAGFLLFVNDRGVSFDKDFLTEMKEKSGTASYIGFSTEELEMLNKLCVPEYHQQFLTYQSLFFPNYSFIDKYFAQRLMGANVVYNIFKADRNTSMIARPIAGVMDTFPDREMQECDMPFEGETRPFQFDSGRRNIDFFKTEVKEHHNVTVNGQSGYRFQLGVTDLTIVKCDNGAALRQLARAMTNEGLQVQLGRKISQPTMLYVPEVDFDTEFDFQKYAKDKGLASPFTRGRAEYTFDSKSVLAGVYCSEAKVECTFMLDRYGIISWQQITPDAVLRALPIGRDQRLPNNIVIDSPYLMILTERKLGTVLGMAFIASPEKSEARKKHDEGGTFMFLVSEDGATEFTIPLEQQIKQDAEQGNATAQYALAKRYATGNGFHQDQTEAAKWYRKAAEQGDAEAQYDLARCYALGEGVRQDKAESVKWARKAAEQGHAEAQFNLARCYYNGEGVRKDMTEVVKWLRLAATQGHAEAKTLLGVSYEYGEGVRKDMTEAVKWYRLAAEQGEQNAANRLRELGISQQAQSPRQRQPQIPQPQSQRSPEKDEQNTALKLVIAMQQADLPQYVAPGIQMVASDYVPHNTVQYTYVVEQIKKDDPMVEIIAPSLKSALIDDLKKNKAVDIMREQKTNLIYFYKDTDNRELFRIRIDHGEY